MKTPYIPATEGSNVKHAHKQPGGSRHVCKHERRIARQERAKVRAENRAQRSPQKQLVVLGNRPGASRKERSKLRKQLAGNK